MVLERARVRSRAAPSRTRAWANSRPRETAERTKAGHVRPHFLPHLPAAMGRLWSNDIRDVGAEAIAAGLETNAALEELECVLARDHVPSAPPGRGPRPGDPSATWWMDPAFRLGATPALALASRGVAVRRRAHLYTSLQHSTASGPTSSGQWVQRHWARLSRSTEPSKS